MAKKPQEPQYIPSALNTPMLNYRTYVMNSQEKLTTILTAFVVGGIAGLSFYGGQFRDADGVATTATQICDVVLFVLIGVLAVVLYMPMRKAQLQKKRKAQLTQQFRSFLETLAVSLSSGMNLTDSLASAYKDLKMEYSESAYITREVAEMINGIQNNIPIEAMLASFGERSQIEDIKNFASVFEVSYRAGGNLKEIIRRTNNIISEKIEIGEEIETAISSNKTQFTAMMCIPVVLMLLLRLMSSSFSASFATPAGVVAITVAIGIFAAAYKVGQTIMEIKG